jgi:hypothetical protein
MGERPVDTDAHGEWWKTLELSAGEQGRLYFADRATAEGFAHFLIDEGAAAVAIEHWRDGRRAGLSVVSRPRVA